MLTATEQTELKKLILDYLKRAEFESILRVHLSQEPARFTDSTDYGEIAEATAATADHEGWIPQLLAVLFYERQGTPLGAWAQQTGARYLGEGGLQNLVTEVDALFDWTIAGRRVTAIGRHVCLIEINNRATGTGVLVGPDLVLTAYHVVHPLMQTGPSLRPVPNSAAALRLTFDFSTTELDDGTWQVNPGTKKAVADPWLLLYSPPHPREIAKQMPPDVGVITEFDYALIRLAERVGEEVLPTIGTRGWATMAPPAMPLGCFQRIHVSQHPAGQALKGSSGRISAIPEHKARIRYTASTLNVSSGSPCWNNDFKLVAVHNFGGVKAAAGRSENQGVPIECILKQVARQLPSAIQLPYPAPPGPAPKPDASVLGVNSALARMWTLGADYPILNRNLLQQKLAAMLSDRGSQLLVVRGARHSGLSFTTRVAEQFLRPFGALAVTLPAADLMDKSADQLLLELRLALSLAAPVLSPGADLTTRSAQVGRHLLTPFLADLDAKFPAKPAPPASQKQVWLLFDGLNQVRLPSETHELIADLANKLPRAGALRLVLIGYDRELTTENMEEDDIPEVTAKDIEAHIRYACASKGIRMDDDKLKALAAKVLASAPAEAAKRLGEIGKAVRNIVRRLGS
jgi:hypothetical protein